MEGTRKLVDPAVFAAGAALFLGLGIAGAVLRPDWVVDHARSVIGLAGLIGLGCLLLLVRLDPPGIHVDLDPSSEPLVASNDPGFEVYDRASKSFGSDDIYVIAVQTQDVFTYENLRVLERITREIRQLQGVRAVQSLIDVISIRYVPETDVVHAAKLMDGVPETAAEIEALREKALANPLYRKTIISPDGKTASINVTFMDLTDAEFVEFDIDGRIRRVLDREETADRHFFVAGRPHVRAVAHHMMVRDLIRLIPLAVVVATVVVWLMTGSLRGTLLPLASCLTATLWTFGGMALMGRDLNVITLALGPMLIAVGSVYGVHVIAHYDEIAAGARSRRDLALETLRYTRTPTMLAGATTCVGFGALMLGNIPATSEFGALSVLGVASVTLLSLTLVPATLALLPLERPRHSSGRAAPAEPRPEDSSPLHGRTRISTAFSRGLDAFLRWLGRTGTRNPTRTLAFWAVLTVVAVAAIPRITINTDYLLFFPEDSPVRSDFDQVSRLVGGAIPIYVVFQSDLEGRFRDPVAMQALDEIQQKLDRLPAVSLSLSAADMIKETNQALNRGDPNMAVIPDSRPAVAESIFFVPKENLRRFATSNHSSANIVVRTASMGSANVRDLVQEIRDVIAGSTLPGGIRADVTGNVIRINSSADHIAGNQIAQVGTAALTILVLVSVVFRSFKLALFAMVPNVVPVVLFFGMLGSGIAWLSVATSLIGSITLGMAIDGTMHYLVCYQTRRAEGGGFASSAHHSVVTVGRPIAITAIMLMCGFTVMLLSGFTTLREFGYLTAITMGICMSTDLGLFPALLVRIRL